MTTGAEVQPQTITVAGQPIRYDIRSGDGRTTPLLMLCGIGAAFGSARWHSADIRRMFRAQGQAGSRRGYLFQLAAGVGWTSLPFLGLLQQPTLILSGDDDPIIPLANAHLMARLIRRSELHVYHGGHVELVTEAPTLTPVINEFLSR